MAVGVDPSGFFNKLNNYIFGGNNLFGIEINMGLAAVVTGVNVFGGIISPANIVFIISPKIKG